MKEKLIVILIGLFLSTALFKNSFAQVETEVMKRYDFSSPQASFESYKRAILNKDKAGTLIHLWQIHRLNKDSGYYGTKLEDIINDSQNQAELEDEALKMFNRIHWNNKVYRITNLEFVKEKERVSEDTAVFCTVILQDKESGDSVIAHLDSLDGTKTWWLEINLD